MPIRTHRGRAAVYRRLWGWPLRSPRHLIGALLVVAAVATTIGFMLPEAPPARVYRDNTTAAEQENAHREAAESSATSAEEAAPPTFSVPQTPPAAAPPNPEGLVVAEKWAEEWANHPPGITREQWLGRLKPHTTEEFLPVMESVEPANVPAAALAGPPVPLGSTATSMDVRLPTDAGDLTVLVINTPQGWRVAGYDWVG